LLIVVLDNDNGIAVLVIAVNPIPTDPEEATMDEHSIRTEPPNEFGSRLSSLTDALFEDDAHLVHAWKTDDSIPSEPPDGLGSHLLSSGEDLFELGINPASLFFDLTTPAIFPI
jgi:hypothetical protein